MDFRTRLRLDRHVASKVRRSKVNRIPSREAHEGRDRKATKQRRQVSWSRLLCHAAMNTVPGARRTKDAKDKRRNCAHLQADIERRTSAPSSCPAFWYDGRGRRPVRLLRQYDVTVAASYSVGQKVLAATFLRVTDELLHLLDKTLTLSFPSRRLWLWAPCAIERFGSTCRWYSGESYHVSFFFLFAPRSLSASSSTVVGVLSYRKGEAGIQRVLPVFGSALYPRSLIPDAGSEMLLISNVSKYRSRCRFKLCATERV